MGNSFVVMVAEDMGAYGRGIYLSAWYYQPFSPQQARSQSELFDAFFRPALPRK